MKVTLYRNNAFEMIDADMIVFDNNTLTVFCGDEIDNLKGVSTFKVERSEYEHINR